jgi:glycerophosphoryl diester phosphodiesterase
VKARLDLRQLFERAARQGRGARRAPPWIIGWQGSVLEAPEASRLGCQRALELGLDGFAVSLWCTRDGGLIAATEPLLEGLGRIAEHTRAQVSAVDAGAQFAARLRGMPPDCAEDFLELASSANPGRWVLCLEEARALALLKELLPVPPPALRIASSDPAIVREAAELGFAAVYRATSLETREREALLAGGVRGACLPVAQWARWEGVQPPQFERWTHADHPHELELAFRLGLEGLLTHEPLRAQAVHALVARTPGSKRTFPLELPRLRMEADRNTGWRGAWEFPVRVHNPFPEPVQVTLGVLPRMGAFVIHGLPQTLALEAGEQAQLPVVLRGGAQEPGADPLLFALLRFGDGAQLLLDGPLERVRVVPADPLPLRVPLLCAGPQQTLHTLLVRRHRQQLLVSMEGARQWADLRVEVRVGERVHSGARGVRVNLPPGFDLDVDGIAFAVRARWTEAGEAREARLCGGLPLSPRSGAAGRLVPIVRA